MTKYVLLTEFAPPDHGGIQATIRSLIEALGDNVTVIAPQTAPKTERRIVRSLFSGSSRPRWWWITAWLQSAKQQGLQTAIFGHFSAAVYAGYMAWRLSGLPYVVLVHGNDLLSEKRRWGKMFIKAALQNAKFVGVNSEFVEHLVHGYGVPYSRIVRTHPFIRQQDVSNQALHHNGKRLITISRLVPRKNIGNIIEAVNILRTKYSDIHLDIVGDGSERKKLENLVHERGLSDAVTFHGAIDDETKTQLLQQANVFVMAPTILDGGTDVEGLGLVYLEAAGCGLPIVASGTGGVQDAVIHEKTGLLVDPEQPDSIAGGIAKLLSNPALAQQYGQAGKVLVEKEFTDTTRIGRFLKKLKGYSPNDQPLVSVIIPAYQSADTIAATLESVKNQTWKKLEIIVVDDGSTDNLKNAVKPFIYDITMIQQQNSGAPTARNNGFDHSRGGLVLFLDADTVLEPEAIEKMVTAMETHPNVSFVYSDFFFGWKKFHLFEYSGVKLRQQNYIHTTTLLRRSAFPRFDPALKKFQDWDLWLTMDEQGSRGLWIPEVLFRVTERQGGSGMSTWLPSFMYRLPWIGRGRGNIAISKYREAERVIRIKHSL